jgi:hypothetical protein
LTALDGQLRQMDAKHTIFALGLDLLHVDMLRQFERTLKLP